MRTKPTKKYFALLLVFGLLGLALGAQQKKPSQTKNQKGHNAKSGSVEKNQKGQGHVRPKRDLATVDEIEDQELLEDVTGGDLISKLGFDGSLLRVRRQNGGWRDHPYRNRDDSDSDSDDDSGTDSDSTTTTSTDSDSSTTTTTTTTTTSSDSDDDHHHHHHHHHHRRRWRGGWGDGGGWGR